MGIFDKMGMGNLMEELDKAKAEGEKAMAETRAHQTVVEEKLTSIDNSLKRLVSYFDRVSNETGVGVEV
jgi:hypothetical protein